MSEQMNITKFSGFFKIWRTHKETGVSELLINQKNKILYQGSDLLAFALAGVKYAKISHIYVGFENYDDTSNTFTLPDVDKDYDVLPFTSYGAVGPNADKGYFRLPLSYNPTFQSSAADYENNVVIFSTILAFDATVGGSSADFQFSDHAVTQSHLYEVALAGALNPTTISEDIVFSRAVFNPIMFDQSYNLTVSWGIQFLS